MTDQEAKLLIELRNTNVWEKSTRSFEVHFDAEGRLATIEIKSRHKLSPRISTAEEIRLLSENVV